LGRIHGAGDAHLARQIQPVRILVGDHDVPRGRVPHHGGSHDSDGPGAGDEHILAQHGKRKRGMDGIAEGIENRGDIQIYAGLVTPQVGHRHRDVIGKRAGAVHADALDVRAQMPPAGQAIAAAAADHVTFAAHQIARVKIADVGAHFHDLADEFVADRHGHGNGALRPFVPVVDVNVGAANARARTRIKTSLMPMAGSGSLRATGPARACSLTSAFMRSWPQFHCTTNSPARAGLECPYERMPMRVAHSV
jgi:hypothetical protein